MSKSQSGLGRLKRDWSNASITSASCSSEAVDWEPTPPKKQQVEADEKLEKANKRLLVIKQALASMEPNKPVLSSTPVSRPLGQSLAVNNPNGKRPSLGSADATIPTKKPRQLPPSWRDDPLTTSSISRKSSSSTVKSTSSNRPSTASTTGNAGDSKSYTVPAPSSSGGSSKQNKMPKLFLSQEQTHILKLVEGGSSVFYTGSAGTGKSVLLREIIKTMQSKYPKNSEAVAITASTGIAACNIGGVTIHSFAGIGLGNDPAEVLMERVKKNRKAFMRWLKTKVLIIDEVSMVDGDLFDKLATIGSIVKKKPSTPFGGIQVIVTGDFFQLPPVSKGGVQVKFAFEAEHWQGAIIKTFNLTKVFRQKDQEFVDMLNEMRFGRLSQKSVQKFRSLSREVVYDDGLGPTELFPRREDVDRSNEHRIQRLPTHEVKFLAVDAGNLIDPEQRNKLLSNFMAPKDLRLRVNAQVMLIKNVDEQLVNGTMGRVLRFVDPGAYADETGFDTTTGEGATGAIPKRASTTQYPEVEFCLANGQQRKTLVTPELWKVELPNGDVQVSRLQFPLILAWAMSIHKSQGQTLDRVKVDLSRVFEKGQAYVALSRATSLEGLQVLNFDPNKVNAHEKVAKWTRTLETIADDS